jgi:hypothetical protein
MLVYKCEMTDTTAASAEAKDEAAAGGSDPPDKSSPMAEYKKKKVAMDRIFITLTPKLEADQFIRMVQRHNFNMAVWTDEGMGYSLLHWATYYSRPELVFGLLKEKCAVDSYDLSMETPLFIACSNGDLNMAVLLVNLGANVRHASATRLTPLHAASTGGHVPIIRYLLSKGAEVDAKEVVLGYTSLYEACSRGDLEAVQVKTYHLRRMKYVKA